MTEREYFVIIGYTGTLLLVELTPERQSVIDSEYSHDAEDYFYGVISEEFDLSVNDTSWTIVPESCITCFGRNPSITKL